jgi:hypothetical protein
MTAIRRFLAARGSTERAIVAMLYTWSALFMLVSGMRLVAPAFAFGLASVMPPRRARPRKGSKPVPGARTSFPFSRAGIGEAAPFRAS